jgi:hypothetical protein
MPKREDETFRNIYPHPPSCTCARCTAERLRRLKKEAHPSYVSKCPKCGQKSLWYNGRDRKYECLNLKCTAAGRTLDEIRGYKTTEYMTEGETDKAAELAARRQRHQKPPLTYNYTNRYRDYEKPRGKKGVPGCLIFLIVIFSIAMLTFGLYNLYKANTPETTDYVDTTDTSDTGEQTSEDNGGEQSNILGDYYLGLVYTPEGVLGGSECYGEFIVLINNEEAVNPSYNQLITFLQQDGTDQFPYQDTMLAFDLYYGTAESYIDIECIQDIIYGSSQPSAPRICADFAERLHNEAEMAGIRCAYVSVDLSGVGHALNAFQTTDRGLIYIDDTGKVGGYGPTNCDKTVDVQVGQQYTPTSIFPESGWSTTWESIGIVTDVLITWDGEWKD